MSLKCGHKPPVPTVKGITSTVAELLFLGEREGGPKRRMPQRLKTPQPDVPGLLLRRLLLHLTLKASRK